MWPQWLQSLLPTRFICGICMETLPSSEQFGGSPCYLHRYCTTCMSQYIDVKARDNISAIGCPFPICARRYLDPLHCRPFLPSETFVRWCDALCEAAVSKTAKTYCPYRDCSELVLSEYCGDTVEGVECPGCRRSFCFRCGVAPWHEGSVCDEKRKRTDEVLLEELAAEFGWQRCPDCGHCVERSEGCHVVECRCGTKFCIYCGSKWTSLHFFTPCTGRAWAEGQLDLGL